MRQLIRFRAPAFSAGLLAILLGGCGESPSATQSQPPAEIHGDLISGAKTTAASAPAAPSSVADTKAAAPASDYALVGFDKLAAYGFVVDDTPFTNAAASDKANDQIPAFIKSFNDKKISVKGFMLPLKVANGSVSEFLIMKDQSLCCYGTTPKINEWISVKTTGPGVKPVMDTPVSICGTLHVGAQRENGYLVGIYQMDGDKLVETDN
jgi:hypothetical protein